jgi:hypothetical protein
VRHISVAKRLALGRRVSGNRQSLGVCEPDYLGEETVGGWVALPLEQLAKRQLQSLTVLTPCFSIDIRSYPMHKKGKIHSMYLSRRRLASSGDTSSTSTFEKSCSFRLHSSRRAWASAHRRWRSYGLELSTSRAGSLTSASWLRGKSHFMLRLANKHSLQLEDNSSMAP